MHMGSTDKNDQMTKLQRCRHNYKWPGRLMVKFFVWSAFNGYVIQNLNKPRIIPGKWIQAFRMFIDELCHDMVGSHRRALVPMSRCTSAGDEAWNQTSLVTYHSEWKEQLEATVTDVLCVQKSTSSPKEWIRRPKTKTCQSALKLFTGANSVKCFCALLPAMKTVSNYITRK